MSIGIPLNHSVATDKQQQCQLVVFSAGPTSLYPVYIMGQPMSTSLQRNMLQCIIFVFPGEAPALLSAAEHSMRTADQPPLLKCVPCHVGCCARCAYSCHQEWGPSGHHDHPPPWPLGGPKQQQGDCRRPGQDLDRAQGVGGDEPEWHQEHHGLQLAQSLQTGLGEPGEGEAHSQDTHGEIGSQAYMQERKWVTSARRNSFCC